MSHFATTRLNLCILKKFSFFNFVLIWSEWFSSDSAPKRIFKILVIIRIMFSFSRATERTRDFFSDLRDVLQLRHLRHRRQQPRLQHAGTSEVQTLHPVPPCLHGHRICPRYWNFQLYRIHPLMAEVLLSTASLLSRVASNQCLQVWKLLHLNAIVVNKVQIIP